MLSALLFALMQPNIAAIKPAATFPETADIQFALAMDWIMKSSSGIQFSDYAVRNLECAPVELKKPADGDEASQIWLKPDIPTSYASCRFEYATQTMKKRNIDRKTHQPHVRRFSKRELKRIPETQWMKEEEVLVKYLRSSCKYRGRAPKPGECTYWTIDRP
jgi:hypothetical protein